MLQFEHSYVPVFNPVNVPVSTGPESGPLPSSSSEPDAVVGQRKRTMTIAASRVLTRLLQTPPAASVVLADAGATTPVLDAELVERNLAGDSRAFEELNRRYFRRISGRVLRVLASPRDLEEVTQD